MKHTTDFAENQRNSLVRCLFGDSCPAGRRIAGAAIGLLLLASAAMALTFLNFGDELVAVRADSDGQNISCSDALTETPDCPEAQDDPYYGHLYIDTTQEGAFESGEKDEACAELCHLSFELYPDEMTPDTSVTLYGMMPEGAAAEVVDVTQQYPDADDVSEETTEDATVIAAYNIIITDGEDEFQPNENRPIRVEITNPQIVTDGATEVWHISDDGTRERITEFSVSDGKIVFFATGFSVYAIVSGPEPYVQEENDPVTSVADLTGERALSGFYVLFRNSSGQNVYWRNAVNSKGCLRETTDIGAAAVWFFEPDGESFRIYSAAGSSKKYIRNTTGNELELTDSGADSIEISAAAAQNAFYFKKSGEDKWLQHSKSGNGIRYWTDVNNAQNSSMFIYFVDNGTPPDDYYRLDGKSWGLVNYANGVEGNALMADESSNSLSMMTLVVRTDDQRETLFVAEDSDITVWTFHSVSGDIYTLSTDVGGSEKYLRIGDTLTLTDEDGASPIRVTPKDGKIRLGSGGKYVTYSDGCFIAGGNSPEQPNQWLHLAELSGLGQTDYVTYSSDKISVSDAPDGSSVIVYTRVWNDDYKAYEFFAVDHDGTLYPCYERGDNIMWVGRQINTLLWNFIEYQYDDGTPKYYYELYNPYSRKFIAPQIKGNQILSDSKIGINLPGRRENQYYSTILAWDSDYYAFAGVKPDDADSRILSCYRDEADTFYFARINEPLKTLTKVGTLDNAKYGITMKMVNFPDPTLQNYVLDNTGNTRGLLSTDLKADGYPMAAKGSLSQLFGSATPVNHLFIESIYNASGYFEYDSCQNFATLVDDNGHVGNTFTVYKELGTTDGADRSTLKHGQFFPYDSITAGVYSYVNPENLYSASAVIGDPEAGLLPESDPRKYEKLHTVGSSPDYYNGMEIDAEFVQPPGGKDSWGHDIIFEFKGDDDFWLYVDDELVIDLGGIHSALAGNVNFSTGGVEVNGRKSNLREVFKSNYTKRHPDATSAEVKAYLSEYFDDNAVIFKDYSAHTMKVFYMERGAGASNLHLRFNVNYLIPGHVLLTKKLTGTQDVDFDNVEFPFQIWYKEEGDSREHLLESSVESIKVTYQNSTQLVSYQDVYSPPNSMKSYRSVYFLNPGMTAEVHFPATTTEYRIIECGVNIEVYDGVYVNGVQVAGETIGNTKRRLFDSGWIDVVRKPTIVFENHVDRDALRTLAIEKRLYDEAGNEIPPGEDDNTFSYRLYLSNGADDVLRLANMHKYYVKDPDGNICSWDAENQRFVSLGKKEISELTDSQKKAATFETSMNGAISMIPAWYTVGVPNLPVGTRFRVVERDYEMPLGYRLIGYERENETYLLDPGSDENTGWVRANESPTMAVKNQRGWELKVDKVWSDAQFVDSHESIYTAVYVRGSLLEGSVRQISHPDTTVRYFFDRLQSGRTIDDYRVREAIVTDPVVGAGGVVTGYSSIIPLNEDEFITVGSVPKGGGIASSNKYFVGYSEGTPERTALDIPAPGNIRADLIFNTRSEGVSITLYDMKTRAPLSGGKFRLSHGEDNLGTFTSDAHGRITVLYDVKHGEDYTLTQTGAPDCYIGVPNPIVFSVDAQEADHTVTVTGNDAIWASGRSANARKRDGSHHDSPIIAYIDVFNKPFTLEARKISDRTGAPLAGAHFALYRSVKVIGGEAKDLDPMRGYEDLATGEGGIIPKIDNSLDPGKYYLTELQSPQNYEGMSEDIVFTVSELGFVTVDSAGHGDMLRQSDSEYENAYSIVVPNRFIYTAAELTVTKTVTGAFGDTEHDFRFTLSVEGADFAERYEWSKNGEPQSVPLRSGGSFTLRHGDSVVITLPKSMAVTVTEENEDYQTTFALSGEEAETTSSKTFVITDSQTLDVVNKRSMILPTGIRLNAAWPAAILLLSLGAALLLVMRRRKTSS